ncbi:hypothetical protein CRENBAI_023311 [Crenichthys baileyi]|uniref:Uncharacterized protein n=1 Tax=Crenichthys baileyi TaxID=28760 RepID=A0AAV9R8A7_9TELE
MGQLVGSPGLAADLLDTRSYNADLLDTSSYAADLLDTSSYAADLLDTSSYAKTPDGALCRFSWSRRRPPDRQLPCRGILHRRPPDRLLLRLLIICSFIAGILASPNQSHTRFYSSSDYPSFSLIGPLSSSPFYILGSANYSSLVP